MRLVIDGELQPNVEYNSQLIQLDTNERNLSMGGNEIIVEEHLGDTYVFFFTFRGVVDNYAGFLYVPLGGSPSLFGDLDEPDSTQLVEFLGNWYFASHR